MQRAPWIKISIFKGSPFGPFICFSFIFLVMLFILERDNSRAKTMQFANFDETKVINSKLKAFLINQRGY